MSQSRRPDHAGRRALALSAWLYRLFLFVYPATFRDSYGERLTRVFRDACRAALTQHGALSLLPLWGSTFFDLLWTAGGERWQQVKEHIDAMVSSSDSSQILPARLWIALIATLLAFGVDLVASLNLYLLEDTSPLSQAAYSASPLLRFSYDVIYLSALAAGVAACAVVGYALIERQRAVIIGCALLALLVALGGFGGLLVRHTTTFLLLFALFLVLTLSSFLAGRLATTRVGRLLEPRPAAVLGACVGTGTLLLINVVALVLHTISLNPVSHELYMQGQIAGTHLNFLLLVMTLALLTLFIALFCLGRAFRQPARQA